jgi:oligopeptide transport system substrate-binding protein
MLAQRFAGSFLLLSFVALFACSPAAPVAKPTEAPKPAEASKPAESAKPAATAQPREQVFRVASTNPPSLDPGLAADALSIDIVENMFEGLVAFDEKGTISGVHAERWDISPEQTTYTFTLRQGLTWSDGQPITAKDYEYAWKRNIDPETASDYATTLFPVKNAAKINTEGMDPSQLGVKATDDRTLVVTLEEPAAYFLRLASTWTLFPLREDVISAHGEKWVDADKIVTNGPFLLKEWKQDAQITLERNDRYWGPKPVLQQAIYRIFPEGAAEQALAAYEAGEIDSLGTTSFQIPAGQIGRIQSDPKLKAEIKEYPESGTVFIVVNTRLPHLKDPRVRMALGAALDRNLLLTQVLRRAGTPAYTPQPEGIAGRNPDVWQKEDVARAKQLLADAGFPDGRGFPDLTFTHNTSDVWRLMGEHLQQRWKETLGINVKLDNMEFATFLKWRRGDEWRTLGNTLRGDWLSDYEDPNNWYNVLWDSHEDPGMFNTGWVDPEYDALVKQAQSELDRAKREQLYRQAEEVLARGYPVIPVFHYSGRTLVKPQVTGFEPTRVLGLVPLKAIAIR